MKKLLLLTLLSFPFFAYAQNDCKGITKKVDEFRGSSSYVSKPVGGSRLNYISIVKLVHPDSTATAISFSIKTGKENYQARGVFFKLADGTVVKREEEKVDCEYDSNDTYIWSGYVVLTEQEFDALLTSPVVAFQLDTRNEKVTEAEGLKLKNYANCIKEMK